MRKALLALSAAVILFTSAAASADLLPSPGKRPGTQPASRPVRKIRPAGADTRQLWVGAGVAVLIAAGGLCFIRRDRAR